MLAGVFLGGRGGGALFEHVSGGQGWAGRTIKHPHRPKKSPLKSRSETWSLQWCIKDTRCKTKYGSKGNMLHILISRMIYITDFLVVWDFLDRCPQTFLNLYWLISPPKKVLTKTIVDTTSFSNKQCGQIVCHSVCKGVFILTNHMAVTRSIATHHLDGCYTPSRWLLLGTSAMMQCDRGVRFHFIIKVAVNEHHNGAQLCGEMTGLTGAHWLLNVQQVCSLTQPLSSDSSS